MPNSHGIKRVQSLDVLRGIAIIGTLLSNIWVFTNDYDVGSSTGGISQLGKLGEVLQEYVPIVSTMLANGKFLGLLSILFGVGMAIQFESALRHGHRWPWRYEWRSLLLMADGFIHFALVVSIDILMGYALVAIIVAPLLRLRTKWLVMATALAGAMHLFMEFRRMTETPYAEEPLPDDYYRDDSAPTGEWSNVSAPTYFEEVVSRIDDFWVLRDEAFIVAPPLSAFLFLCGVLLWRAGLFKGDERARTLSRRLAIGGLGLGMPLAVWEFLPLPGADVASDFSRYTIAPIVAFGYLGLTLILLRRRGGSGFLARRFADVGRTALSCYMLQNVIALVIFSQWGHLGRLGSLGTFAAWAGISALLMLAAHLWLKRFRQGPFELVWKAAVDAPFRRADRTGERQRREKDTTASVP
ncbi:DUF418 domain-containing protein [Streptomyces ferrugineus]|uniref:DUF418 domain-containing protein n=1 Tax=Streptomyces ferrugineus TaxID=1413221 RepID=A0A7M2SA14_9ACTN|nr:DUF418 domain-containing protein [Streptomyces ferrugineus]QOV33134.1 DUF418 domain-containing protein [Streptomyces ferrugineus]